MITVRDDERGVMHETIEKTLTEAMDRALKKGNVMRAWRSGGGLCFVSIETPRGRQLGSGGMPHLKPSLILAGLDYLADGKAARGGYLTGSRESEDSLDEWVGNGHRLFAKYVGGRVLLQARNFDEKPKASVMGKTFEEAYQSLSEVVKVSYKRLAA